MHTELVLSNKVMHTELVMSNKVIHTDIVLSNKVIHTEIVLSNKVMHVFISQLRMYSPALVARKQKNLHTFPSNMLLIESKGKFN